MRGFCFIHRTEFSELGEHDACRRPRPWCSFHQSRDCKCPYLTGGALVTYRHSMKLPPGAFTPTETAVFLAVLSGARTVREVGERAGFKHPPNAHRHLVKLRVAGLIDWVDGRWATLHPTVKEIHHAAR